MTSNVTPAEIARLRLAAQAILPTSTSPAPGPVDVVRSLAVMQGQDFPGTLWAVGLRSPGSTRTDVAAAFNRGELLRSWVLRGTLHIAAAQDLGWIQELVGGKVLKESSARHRQLGIATPDVGRARDAALEMLAQCRDESSAPGATRDELFAAFEAAGQPTAAQRGMHLLWLLGMENSVVQGPINPAGNGNTQYFVSAEEWIKNPRQLDREEALAELALRYFTSHGPATIKDFQWWTKLTLKDIGIGLGQVKVQLETLEYNGTDYFLAPKIAELLGGTVPGARSLLLLPGFDEYLLGYTDRSAALAPEHAPLTVPGNNGMFKATVVAGGRVAGTWRKAQTAAEKQRQLAGVVLPEIFDGLGPAQQKALEKAAKEYAAFLAPPTAP